MKKTILLIAVLMLIGCSNYNDLKDINCLYQGGIIYHVHDFRSIDGSKTYKIKYGEKIIRTKAYQINFDYKVGDTINRPCLTTRIL